MRIRADMFRQPDLLLLQSATDPRRENRFWTGADLALEVVSRHKRKRDLVQKRADYAEGRIPEYWIVDPQTETITVLRLDGEAYVEAGQYRRGDTAPSVLLTGFSVDVAAVFDAD
jgi:Uma2 family endonuclease